MGWLVAGVLGGICAGLVKLFDRQHLLLERVVMAGDEALLEQQRITLEVMRSSYLSSAAMLQAVEDGTLDEVEPELRELVERLGDELAKAEENVV